MESALIVSSMDKGIAYLTELLGAASIHQIVALRTCGEARRRLIEQDFDLIVINAPLQDESGERLARHIASKGVGQVILFVAAEQYDAVCAVCGNDGVLTVSKPSHKAIVWSALQLARAAHNRVRRAQDEAGRLKQKIEDIRIVDRAKYILISHLNMSEQEAHRYIEKQAMDMRATKRLIAEGILKTYEN